MTEAGSTRRDQLAAVLPPLLSGRPLIDTSLAGEPAISVDDVRHLRDNERMILASAQLRALVMASQNGNLPRIGVVFSTNRPQSLDEALERIRRQRGVEVELRIGVHGAAAPNLGPLAAG